MWPRQWKVCVRVFMWNQWIELREEQLMIGKRPHVQMSWWGEVKDTEQEKNGRQLRRVVDHYPPLDYRGGCETPRRWDGCSADRRQQEHYDFWELAAEACSGLQLLSTWISNNTGLGLGRRACNEVGHVTVKEHLWLPDVGCKFPSMFTSSPQKTRYQCFHGGHFNHAHYVTVSHFNLQYNFLFSPIHFSSTALVNDLYISVSLFLMSCGLWTVSTADERQCMLENKSSE